jgi:naphthalene 1,2-dioxygenase ferredoxin component
MSDLQWHDVMAEDELPRDDVWAVKCKAGDIAFYGVDGQPYATDNLCTHGNARLCEGFFEGHEIECPFAPRQV